MRLSRRQDASTLISLFRVPLALSDPLCQVNVGENWKRVAHTKPSLVANIVANTEALSRTEL